MSNTTFTKSLLIAGCAALAAVQSINGQTMSDGAYAPKPSVIPVGLSVKAINEGILGNQKKISSTSTLLNARIPYKENGENQAITEQPEGECTTYVRSSFSYWSLFGSVFTLQDRGSIAKIVKGADNTVYYYNPFGMQAVKSWLKGTIAEDGVMTFTFPQPVMVLGSTEYFASVVSVKEGAFGFAEEQQYQLKYDGENVVAVDPETILALTSWADADKSMLAWTGYGDKNPVCVPNAETPQLPPSDIQAEEWSLLAGSKFRNVSVGFDGNDVWIRGLHPDMTDAWTKAQMEGGDVVMPTAQYMGPNYNSGHYEYLQTCQIDSVLNPEFDVWDEKYVVKDNLKMEYNPEACLMKAFDNNNILFTTTADAGPEGEYLYTSLLRQPIIKKQDRNVMTPPMAPVLVEYSEFEEGNEYGYIVFNFLPYDTDYNLIDTDKLYYELLVNGKPFTFYPDEYQFLDEEMEMIPYNFTDEYWFETNGQERTLYFFFNGMSALGLRTVYVDGSTKIYSDYTAVVGDKSVKADSVFGDADIVAVEYYDLAGRKISSPVSGISIVREIHSDGSATCCKKMVK